MDSSDQFAVWVVLTTYSGTVPLESNSKILSLSIGNSSKNSYVFGASIIFGWILCWIKAWMEVRKKQRRSAKVIAYIPSFIYKLLKYRGACTECYISISGGAETSVLRN